MFSGTLFAADTYSYTDLVGRLTDMEQVALLPNGETTAEATSYDRASKVDENGKFIGWDANGDNAGSIKTLENGSILMAEIEGPGMINHIWSARPEDGHVKIFIDGSETPVVDLPFKDYFSRKVVPFDRETLVYTTTANGCNNWTPIPFQKSCRIVGEKGWGAYYYFQYVKFPAGTTVPTFSMNLDDDAKTALDNTDNRFKSIETAMNNRATFENVPPPGQNAARGNRGNRTRGQGNQGNRPAAPVRISEQFKIAPGETKEYTLTNPAAITGMRAQLVLPNDENASRDLLRGVTISIYWDGEEKPSVWAPIGDFFGVVNGGVSCLGYPNGVTESGMFYNNWYMPYKSAKIVVCNENKEEVAFDWFGIRTRPLRNDIAEYGRFHAKWHRNAYLPTEPERWIDWTILKTEGKGKYVGVSLHIENFRGSWWGEGDEKFFIDGEKFPSYFGTGSEDYFGYAWSSANRFVQAFHSQPTNKGNRTFIVNNRWHITDAVAFNKSFDGYIEKYYKDDRPCLYAGTAFWYLEPGGKDFYDAVPLSERVGYYENTITTHKLPAGGVSSKDLFPKERHATLSEQDMGGFNGEWERDVHLWWKPGKVDEFVTLKLSAPEDGKYVMFVRMTTAKDYGVHQFSIAGKNVGEKIDLYTEEVRPTSLMELGVVDLKKGDNELVLKVVGKNEKSSGYLAGIDYIVLVPVK